MTTRFLLSALFSLVVHYSFAQSQVAAYLLHTDSMEISLIKGVSSYAYHDMHPSMSPDGKYLYFASERGGQSWSFPYMDTRSDSSVYFLSDLYRSEREGRGWSKPECLPFGLNSSREDHSPIIEADALYFFSMHPEFAVQDGPFFKASEDAHLWDTPVGLGGGITSFFEEKRGEVNGFTFGPNKQWLVFSWGKAGEQKDLYLSINYAKKGWSMPQKMAISTPNDDIAPFLTANGKNLIFATPNLEEGFGGYDLVLVHKGERGDWGNLINLSAPFNSDADETGFRTTKDGRKAVMVRDGMLYEVNLTGAHPYLRNEE